MRHVATIYPHPFLKLGVPFADFLFEGADLKVFVLDLLKQVGDLGGCVGNYGAEGQSLIGPSTIQLRALTVVYELLEDRRSILGDAHPTDVSAISSTIYMSVLVLRRA